MMDNMNDDKSSINPVQVQKFLDGVDFPASKEELISTARDEGADDNVIQTLQRMPDDQFQTPADVSEAIGKIV
jgi:hypothetical protein